MHAGVEAGCAAAAANDQDEHEDERQANDRLHMRSPQSTGTPSLDCRIVNGKVLAGLCNRGVGISRAGCRRSPRRTGLRLSSTCARGGNSRAGACPVRATCRSGLRCGRLSGPRCRPTPRSSSTAATVRAPGGRRCGCAVSGSTRSSACAGTYGAGAAPGWTRSDHEMKHRHLALRGLVHYWRTNLAVVLGRGHGRGGVDRRAGGRRSRCRPAFGRSSPIGWAGPTMPWWRRRSSARP